MNIKISGAALLAMLVFASIAKAQTRTPVINQRERVQERRINRGVRSGVLTGNEARHLRAGERKISRDKRIAKADGHVTVAERRHLRREESRSSRAIYRKKHNDRVRG